MTIRGINAAVGPAVHSLPATPASTGSSVSASTATALARTTPALPADVRLATVSYAETRTWGARVLVYDALIGLLTIARVAGFSGESMRVDNVTGLDARLSLVDDDLDPLRDDAPVTDGKRYWLVVPV